MYSTSVNYYIPRQTVVLYSGTSPRRYQTVYAKTLKIHKGIDNQLQFQFLNQEQKPVNITGKTISCTLMNYDGTKILLEKALTPLLPLTGLATLSVTMNETLMFDAALSHYSLTIPSGSFDYPVFVDDNSGGRGKIDIVDSVYPKYIKSTQLNIPDHAVPTPSAPVTYYTESYLSNDTFNQTFQIQLIDYAGTIEIQGSVSGSDTEWYSIYDDSTTYTGFSETEYVNIDGYHKYIRVRFISTAGTIGKVLIR